MKKLGKWLLYPKEIYFKVPNWMFWLFVLMTTWYLITRIF